MVEGPDGGLAIPVSTGPLTVLVIMDKSGSMAERWDQRTKWQVTNEAFSKAIEGVSTTSPLERFCSRSPTRAASHHSVVANSSTSSRARTSSRVGRPAPAPESPQGSTPLGRAFQEADFHIEKACNDGLLDGHFRVIILTDGQPTCTEDPDLFTRLPREWRLLGIQTLVFGLPGCRALPICSTPSQVRADPAITRRPIRRARSTWVFMLR